MNNNRKIFVDMDGVLSDFEARFIHVNGYSPSSKKNTWSSFWRNMVDGNHFATLDLMPNAPSLIDYLKNIKGIDIAILSSSGVFADHSEVQRQKLEWLKSNDIDWPAIIVPGKQYKAGFANSKSLIIDDSLSVITSFRQKAGIAILHDDKYSYETIETLDSVIARWKEYDDR